MLVARRTATAPPGCRSALGRPVDAAPAQHIPGREAGRCRCPAAHPWPRSWALPMPRARPAACSARRLNSKGRGRGLVMNRYWRGYSVRVHRRAGGRGGRAAAGAGRVQPRVPGLCRGVHAEGPAAAALGGGPAQPRVHPEGARGPPPPLPPCILRPGCTSPCQPTRACRTRRRRRAIASRACAMPARLSNRAAAGARSMRGGASTCARSCATSPTLRTGALGCSDNHASAWPGPYHQARDIQN